MALRALPLDLQAKLFNTQGNHPLITRKFKTAKVNMVAVKCFMRNLENVYEQVV